jgi:hypothetical protein
MMTKGVFAPWGIHRMSGNLCQGLMLADHIMLLLTAKADG